MMEDSRFQLINVSGIWNRDVSPMPELLVSSQVPEEVWRDTYHHVVEYQSKISKLLATARKIQYRAWGMWLSLTVVMLSMIGFLNLDSSDLSLYLFASFSLPLLVTFLILRYGARLNGADKCSQVRLLLEWKRYVEQLQRLYRPYGIRLSLLQPKRSHGSKPPPTIVGALQFSPARGVNRLSPHAPAVRIATRVAPSTTTPTSASLSPASSLVEELQKLADLKARGDLTHEEFVLAKARILQPSHTTASPDWAVSTAAVTVPPVSLDSLPDTSPGNNEFAVAQVLPMDDEMDHSVPPSATPSPLVPSGTAPFEVEQGSANSSAPQQAQGQVQPDVEKAPFLSNHS